MCQECSNAVKRFYPDLSEKDRYEILMSATAFPFSDPEQLAERLSELVENTDGSMEGAIVYAHKQMDEEWKKFRAERAGA